MRQSAKGVWEQGQQEALSLVPTLTSCHLGDFFPWPEPQFPHLENKKNHSQLQLSGAVGI